MYQRPARAAFVGGPWDGQVVAMAEPLSALHVSAAPLTAGAGDGFRARLVTYRRHQVTAGAFRYWLYAADGWPSAALLSGPFIARMHMAGWAPFDAAGLR